MGSEMCIRDRDGYVQQKFSRLLMGSNNIDHCTRLCHSPSVEAMLVSLGSGATSNSYIDYEDAGCIVITGSDANSNHPVAAARMRRAVLEHGAKLIVINPRRIEMCDFAELWLRPRPGTDVALYNGMAKVILDEGLADDTFIQNRTEGFEPWRQVIDKYDLESVEKLTGVPASDIANAARIYASPPFSGSCLVWGMGITQHTNGTANAHGLLNLAFVTGQLGSPGSGISPLRHALKQLLSTKAPICGSLRRMVAKLSAPAFLLWASAVYQHPFAPNWHAKRNMRAKSTRPACGPKRVSISLANGSE